MTSHLTIRGHNTLQTLAAFLVALAIGMLIPVADSVHHLSLYIGGFVAATVVGVLFSVPTRLLPGITLLATLLVPTDVTLLPHVLQGAALGAVPLAVWIIRTPRSTRTPSFLRVLAFLLGVWLILSEIFAPLHTHRGSEWLVTVGIAVVFSIISAPTGLKSRDFRALFLAVATVLGVYALLEGFLLHHNLLFGSLLEHTIWWAGQQHGVSYRVTTLLGHPLINGTVFSAAAVLAASDLVQKPQRPRVSVARLMVLIGATAATHSRGAAIALAIGIVVVIAFSRGRGRGQGTRRLVLIISSTLGVALLISGLQARDESSQGQASALVRVTVIRRASETLHGLEPFGAGPGNSEDYRKVMQLPGSEIALENSYAELAVSLGPIGALLMVALLIAVVVFGLQNELVTGEAAAVLTILVDIGGFNAIEGHRPVLILIGLFAISIITAPRSVVTSSVSVERHAG
jgi:hypothetical protein